MNRQIGPEGQGPQLRSIIHHPSHPDAHRKPPPPPLAFETTDLIRSRTTRAGEEPARRRPPSFLATSARAPMTVGKMRREDESLNGHLPEGAPRRTKGWRAKVGARCEEGGGRPRGGGNAQAVALN